MKTAAFEEKEYEAPLYNQLEHGDRRVWAPGQVFEHQIGIDRGLFVADPRLWRLLGRTRPVGAFLNRYDLDFLWHDRPRRPLPDFRLNLFIQAKRSGYYKRPPWKIRDAGLDEECWCFAIDHDQQTALEAVQNRLRNRALIVYAAPAFHTFSQLFAHTKRGTIIQNSTFPEVGLLTGHSKWYYPAGGTSGVANPNPSFHDTDSLDNLISRLRQIPTATSEGTSAQQLSSLAKSMIAALQDMTADENPRVAFFFEELRSLDRELDRFEQSGEQIRPLFQVATFSSMFDVEWLVIS